MASSPQQSLCFQRSQGLSFLCPGNITNETLAVPKFVDRHFEGEAVKPLPLKITPFKLVEGVNELKMLAAKLQDVDEFAIMHGADHDILWLQWDFGIYMCNLFDTGQASRLLQLERNSLEYLLHHFCEVNANKEYQNADWRLRPLLEEMHKLCRGYKSPSGRSFATTSCY